VRVLNFEVSESVDLCLGIKVKLLFALLMLLYFYVLCCVVYVRQFVHNDTHTHEQFLQVSVGLLGLGLDILCVCLGLAFCAFFAGLA